MNLEISWKDQAFIIAALDLLGAKIAPKDNESYTEEGLKYANDLQNLINRVFVLEEKK